MSTIETHASSAPASSGALACVAEWVGTTDHKRLGRLYLGAAGLSLLVVGVIAALLGLERVSPTREMLEVGSLTQLFAIERFGLTYLVLLPALVGLAVGVVPLQVGARSLALPRLATAGFWTWLVGSVLAVWALVNNGGPGGGNPRFVDMFQLALVPVVGGLLATVVSVFTSILTTRAPGMNMRRLPYFTWSVLVSSLALVIALPIFLGNVLILFVAHRYPSTSVFAGNRAISDWAGFGFTQPTTVLMALPVLGLLADAAATASGRRLRPRGVLFTGIGLAGLGVLSAALQQNPPVLGEQVLRGDLASFVEQAVPFALVHGLPLLGVLVAVGLTAKHLAARPKVQAPVVFALLAGLLLLLGTAGNLVNHVVDLDLIGSTFEEGTWLAVVLAGVLAAMGGVTYWGPKWWGRRLPMLPSLGLALVTFGGAALASLPLMVAGFADQPGAVFPYIEPGTQVSPVNFDYSGPLELWNVLSTVGLVLVVVATLAFVALALKSFTSGESAGDDPWDGQTLEWATTSPAPADNFAAVHVVSSAEPLLDLKPSTRSDA